MLIISTRCEPCVQFFIPAFSWQQQAPSTLWKTAAATIKSLNELFDLVVKRATQPMTVPKLGLHMSDVGTGTCPEFLEPHIGHGSKSKSYPPVNIPIPRRKWVVNSPTNQNGTITVLI